MEGIFGGMDLVSVMGCGGQEQARKETDGQGAGFVRLFPGAVSALRSAWAQCGEGMIYKTQAPLLITTASPGPARLQSSSRQPA